MSEYSIIPIGTRMLVDKHPKKQETESGLIIADTEASITNSGTVLEVGSDVKEAKKGDVVLYTQHAGVAVEYGGERYFFLREAEIVTLIRNNKA